MEKQNITMVIILDPSVAFDTVDHGVLLEIMKQHFRLTDTALKCLDEYLRLKVLQGMHRCLIFHSKETQLQCLSGIMQQSKHLHLLQSIN